MTNEREQSGGNNPPNPIDEITAKYDDTLAEAANWLDGVDVENEAQMKAVDVLRKSMRAGRLELVAGEKSAAAPLHDAWKAEKALWKPTIDDFKMNEDGLVSAVNKFKQKLAAEKREAERKAYEEAEMKRRDAERAAAQAAESDIEAQREAAAMAQEAQDAKVKAAAASKDTVGGMRKVTKYETTDHKKALHWIALYDRDAITAFIDEYVRRNHKECDIEGVKVWTEKEAF